MEQHNKSVKLKRFRAFVAEPESIFNQPAGFHVPVGGAVENHRVGSKPDNIFDIPADIFRMVAKDMGADEQDAGKIFLAVDGAVQSVWLDENSLPLPYGIALPVDGVDDGAALHNGYFHFIMPVVRVIGRLIGFGIIP